MVVQLFAKEKVSTSYRLVNKHDIGRREIRMMKKLLDVLKKNLLFWEARNILNVLSCILYLGNYVTIFLFFTGTLIFRSKHCQLHGN